MQKLVQGIHRFRTEVFEAERRFFEELARGQRPHAMLVACSDSRVDPALLTGSRPGEIFVLRNAGNLVPPYGASRGGEAAAVEYAVAALGVQDVVVCGHSHCGAVRAMLDPDSLAGMPAVSRWLDHAEPTRRIVAQCYSHLEEEARLMAAVEENVICQLENLRTHPAVAAAVASGGLGLHGWVYKMETGEVFSYDSESGQFLRLAADSPPARPPANARRAARTRAR